MNKIILLFLGLSLIFINMASSQVGEKKVYDIDFSDFNLNKEKKNEEPEKEKPEQASQTKTPNLIDFNRSTPSLTDINNAGFILNSTIDKNKFGTASPRNIDTFGKNSDVATYKIEKLPKQVKDIEEAGGRLIFTDQKLGEIITTSEYLDFYYRDHGQIDGDVIEIFVDEEPFVSRTKLTGKYKTIRLYLKDGFSRLDLYSLFDGKISPTTVEWVIKDKKGITVADNILAVSKGFKGTIIVIKN